MTRRLFTEHLTLVFCCKTSKKSYLKDLAILSFEQSVRGSRRSSLEIWQHAPTALALYCREIHKQDQRQQLKLVPADKIEDTQLLSHSFP